MAGEFGKKTNIAGRFAMRPDKMDGETLAWLIEAELKRLPDCPGELFPFIKELQSRFLKLSRDKVSRRKARIAGCRTWADFCEYRLGRTESAIRNALAVSYVSEPEKPKILLAALRRLRPIVERTEDSIWFSRAENGNVLLTVISEGSVVAREELPLPAPTSCTSEYPGWDKSLYKYVTPAIVIGDRWSLPADEGAPELFAPPFQFGVNLTNLVDFLKRCDGDPFIVVTAGGEGPIRMYQTDHGQLHIERDDMQTDTEGA